MGAFGKRLKGWTQWTHFSVPRPSHLATPQRAAHLGCLCSYWWTCACCPQVCTGRDEKVHFDCIVLPGGSPPLRLLACLLLVVTKFGRTGWRGDFCFWTTEFFICSDQISCEKEEANKWSSCMPCSHSACRGLEGTKALYTPTLWLCHVAFPEGSSPACLPVGMC